MHFRVYCLFILLISFQPLIGENTPTAHANALYFLTNGKHRLPLHYLTKQEQAQRQHILHLYQHKKIDKKKQTISSSKQKKLLLLLLLLLLGGSLCYIAYHAFKPPSTPSQPHKAQLPHAAAHQIPRAEAMPHMHKAPLFHTSEQKAPPSLQITEEMLMSTFLQAIDAMHHTDNNFRQDTVGMLVDSMHSAQRISQHPPPMPSFIPPATSMPYCPPAETYGYQTYSEPLLSSLPKVPTSRPSSTSGQAGTPKPPISVYVPAGSTNDLQERLNKLRK